jgi:hypothetical protein
MNTALGRRLALGDRVIWMNKDDCQLTGPGTIIRITLTRLRCCGRAKPRGATAARNYTCFHM